MKMPLFGYRSQCLSLHDRPTVSCAKGQATVASSQDKWKQAQQPVKCLCISVEQSELLGTFHAKGQHHAFWVLHLGKSRWTKVKTIWVHMDIFSIENWYKILWSVLTALCIVEFQKFPECFVHMWFSYLHIELQQLKGSSSLLQLAEFNWSVPVWGDNVKNLPIGWFCGLRQAL